MDHNKPKINLHNIKSFLDGNGQRVLEGLQLQKLHIQEQIAYRRLVCINDCAKQDKCIKCGCDFKGKTSVRESCNLERFPDLMSNLEWIKYKNINGIR